MGKGKLQQIKVLSGKVQRRLSIDVQHRTWPRRLHKERGVCGTADLRSWSHWKVEYFSEWNTVAISEEKTETFYYKSPNPPLPKGKAHGTKAARAGPAPD